MLYRDAGSGVRAATQTKTGGIDSIFVIDRVPAENPPVVVAAVSGAKR